MNRLSERMWALLPVQQLNVGVHSWILNCMLWIFQKKRARNNESCFEKICFWDIGNQCVQPILKSCKWLFVQLYLWHIQLWPGGFLELAEVIGLLSRIDFRTFVFRMLLRIWLFLHFAWAHIKNFEEILVNVKIKIFELFGLLHLKRSLACLYLFLCH